MKRVGILAGGSGSRMGGVEKGLIELNGIPVIRIIVNNLDDYEIVTVCRDEEQKCLYSPYSEVIVDHYRGMGPLAGIHAALMYFQDAVLIAGVDMPLIKKRVADMLLHEFRGKEEIADALIPVWEDGRTEPLLACYPYQAIHKIEDSLRRGEKRIMNALDRNRIILYPVESLRQVDNELISFINLNTPDDLKKVEKICSSIDLEEKLRT